jgi:hypothetical protein
MGLLYGESAAELGNNGVTTKTTRSIAIVAALALAGLAILLLSRSAQRPTGRAPRLLAALGAAMPLGHRAGAGGAGDEPANAPPATVNKAVYNAKMLALANLPPWRNCAPVGAAARARRRPAQQQPRMRAAVRKVASHRRLRRQAAPLPPCKPRLWPVHTVYPNAGALLPFRRIVAYYGNFFSPRMGVLGAYPPAEVLAKLKAQAAAWARADPTTPVVPAIDYIAVSAQEDPGRNGKYILHMPPDQIEKALHMADSIHGLLFLDVQPGWSTVRAEVPRLAPYLKLPNVELALDPEFDLVPGKRPGAWRGTMGAAAINFAARYLARLAVKYHLPPKILVIHRFTQRMVTDYHAIRPLPEVEIVMDMDGFGSPYLKISTYKSFIASQPVQFTGFKLFYKNDRWHGGRLMTPAQVLRLSPRPIFILYQ